jgi:NAD(P)-dependent dehydrogenase (short-subunit alcohol dehydrogenase family)
MTLATLARIAAGVAARPAVVAGALAVAGGAALMRGRPDALAGSTALVTGGSRGLGFLLARELARAGCRVAICARDLPELERARAALAREGHRLTALPCDVADRAAVERLVAEVTATLGGLDVLVNNAGLIDVGPLETMTVEDFERALGVMFWGTLYPTLAAVPAMRARGGGRIVNVTSIGGRLSIPHLLPYSCAKFAAVGLSEGLHAELARHGIRVTTVVPGLMRTGSHLRARFKGRQAAEFTWFSLGATLPPFSMDAERAARRIVAAVRRGRSDVVLTVPAKLAAIVHGVLPGTTATLLGWVHRALPDPDGAGTAAAPGEEVERTVGSGALRTATRLGRTAAERFQHQPMRAR